MDPRTSTIGASATTTTTVMAANGANGAYHHLNGSSSSYTSTPSHTPPPSSHSSPSSTSTSPPPPLHNTHPAWPHARKALLLIAVQHAPLAPPPAGVPAAATVRANIARVLAAARAAHAHAHAHAPLIVHVRNAGHAGDADEPGAPGHALALPPLPGEVVLDKRKNNAFAGTRLGELVPPTADLVVVGLQSDFCIRATCSAALGRGNNVFLVEGAHATYDRPEAYAAGGAAVVTPAARVEREIESELEEAGVVLIRMDDLPHLFTDS